MQGLETFLAGGIPNVDFVFLAVDVGVVTVHRQGVSGQLPFLIVVKKETLDESRE